MSPVNLEQLAGELADMAAATKRLNKLALRRDPREHVSGSDALHPDCLYGGTEGAPCRSPSKRPPRDCNCPDNGLVLRHDRATCTDPLVARLDWYAS